ISQQASNLGIQWHVIAMYGPGFFTGRLINRFGALRISATGLLSRNLMEIVGLNVGNYIVGQIFGDDEVRVNCAAANLNIANGVA
ncbi:hypothetical protein MJN51_40370, partial [Salmonella enterica subsp. enterica serovar Kentucky]|nr:hypothetical protein [Salmonella enterica subsp. enterica serovar Kentucky]